MRLLDPTAAAGTDAPVVADADERSSDAGTPPRNDVRVLPRHPP